MENIENLIDEMTKAVISRNDLVMREAEQMIWRAKLKFKSIPEPAINDPLYYVVQACLIKEMARIWAQPPKNIVMEVPDWVKAAPILPQSFSVIDSADISFWEDEPANKVFKAHNIFAPENYLYFI